MSELYNRIEQLCKQKGVNITKMCAESGANRASLTDLKMGRKKTLSAETLSKIAVYFGIPVDLILGADLIKKLSVADKSLKESQRAYIEATDADFKLDLMRQIQFFEIETKELQQKIAELEHSIDKKEPATTEGDGISAVKKRAIDEISGCSDEEIQMFLDILAAVKKKSLAGDGKA